MGPPYTRVRYRIYEKLTLVQRDAIRSKVHEEIQKVRDKKSDA